MQMFSEWSGLVAKLDEIERRIEIIQIHQDLDEQNHSNLPREQPNRHYYQYEFENDEIKPNTQTNNIQVWNLLTMRYLREHFSGMASNFM